MGLRSRPRPLPLGPRTPATGAGLEVQSGSEGAAVYITDCDGRRTNQRWFFEGPNGALRPFNAPRLCLFDPVGVGGAIGGRLQIFNCPVPFTTWTL